MIPALVLVLTITHDMGGRLDARIALIEAMRDAGTHVRIEGLCVSACTLYLGLPGACVTPDAVLGFHGPYTALPGIPLPADEFERATRAMADHYPPAIAEWFMVSARWQIGPDYVTLTGAEAIRLGARRCG